MAYAAALPIIGGFVSAAGAQQSAEAKANAAKYNADIANQNADSALQESAEQERIKRVSSDQQLGQERASYGASGVSGASGSALEVLQSSAKSAELDALNIRHAGQMKAWAYKSGAALDTMSGEEAKIAGNYGAFSAGLGGASSAMAMSGGGGG